jgi:hypothetical protein
MKSLSQSHSGQGEGVLVSNGKAVLKVYDNDKLSIYKCSNINVTFEIYQNGTALVNIMAESYPATFTVKVSFDNGVASGIAEPK